VIASFNFDFSGLLVLAAATDKQWETFLQNAVLLSIQNGFDGINIVSFWLSVIFLTVMDNLCILCRRWRDFQ
jgi:uncharacterized membrane protein YhaH (DUF805 family)